MQAYLEGDSGPKSSIGSQLNSYTADNLNRNISPGGFTVKESDMDQNKLAKMRGSSLTDDKYTGGSVSPSLDAHRASQEEDAFR